MSQSVSVPSVSAPEDSSPKTFLAFDWVTVPRKRCLVCRECKKQFSSTTKECDLRKHWHQEHSPYTFTHTPDKESAIKLLIQFHMKSNLPLSTWDSGSWKDLVRIYEDRFDMSITASTMRQFFVEEQRRIKQAIASRLRNRMFALRLDTTSRSGWTLLGVTAQFVDAATFQQEIITIGMVRVEASDAGIDLKPLVEECLAQYELSPAQVYSYSTDIAAHLIKINGREPEAVDVFGDDPTFSDEKMRGSVHSVQLAVMDYLNPLKEQLDEMREEVRLLRTQLGRNGHSQPDWILSAR